MSRRLSYVLRHDPASIGIALDAAGWVDVDVLLTGLGRHGLQLSAGDLDQVIADNDKQRFRVSADGRRIRASQGHSVAVDLGLEPMAPPAVLFHGTVAAALDGIRANGLDARGRHDVHLSADRDTAARVGSRRGRPMVLTVDAAAMAAEGMVFRRSDNGVWLTAQVPVRHLRLDGEPLAGVAPDG